MTPQIWPQGDGYLLHSLGLRMLDARFHHGFAYNNALFRGLRLDDGYCLSVQS